MNTSPTLTTTMVHMQVRISSGNMRRGQVGIGAGIGDVASDMVGRCYRYDELDGLIEARELAVRW